MQFTSIAVYFILANATGGYVPPQDVPKATMPCGFSGTVVGVQVDREINPTKVMWVDPFVATKHCEVSIVDRVRTLAPGDYHIATTIMGDGSQIPMNQHDPHTSPNFKIIRVTGTPFAPKNLGVVK